MLTQMFLWLAVSSVLMVTANPLLQAIASQTCPICERNALKNQLQNLLYQTANSYQSRPQMCLNQQMVQPQTDLQCKRSCPGCPQPMHTQLPYQQPPVNQPNPPPQPQNIQQQTNPLLAEAISRLFSNPSMKSILDPTTKLFNQHGIEIPRNGPCSNGPPQVVNNYIIVPPEFLMENKKITTEDKNPSNERRKKNKKNNAGGRKTSQTDNTVRVGQVTKANMAAPANTAKINSRNPIGLEQNLRREKVKNPEIKVNVINKNANVKSKESVISVTNTSDKEIVSQTIAIENLNSAQNRHDKTTISNTKDFPIQDRVVEADAVSVAEHPEVTTSKTTDVIRIEIQNPNEIEKSIKPTSLRSNNSNKQVVSHASGSAKKPKAKQSKNYNPTEETVINDFKLKFPYIPEEVVRDLLGHMKRELLNENVESVPTYYPQFPITFDQLYGNRYAPFPFTLVSDINNKSSNRKNSNHNQSKKRKVRVRNRKPKTTTTTESCDVIVESISAEEATKAADEIETTTIISETTVEVPTTTAIATTPTQVPTTAEMVTEPIITENTSEKRVHLNEITSPMKKYTQQNSQENVVKTVIQNEVKIPELGSEDIVPPIYVNDLDDEYYPDFTGDHRYFSGEDYSYFSLEDDRYHYTTDKNFPLEELNRERRRDAHAAPRVRRPQDRHKIRVYNSENNRPSARPIGHRRRPKFRTSPKPTHDINNVTPKVNLILKENANTKSFFVETNTEKPKSEETQFRTPPKLEFIDFETKPINKDIFFGNDYKSSSYSEMKTPQYIFNKNIMEKSTKINEKQKVTEKVQTDFAGSKVATYGSPVYVDLDINKSEIPKQDKIIVMAQTIEGDYW